MGLSDGLNDANKQTSLVNDCVKLIDEQVSAKGGLGGMALKAAYGAVKGIKPGYVASAIEALLPPTLTALDPIWSEGTQAGNPVEHLNQNRSRAADAVLSVTDTRIEKSSNGVVKGAYNQFRKSVKGDVEEAIPGLAKIIGNYSN
jgi:hypothetical protein